MMMCSFFRLSLLLLVAELLLCENSEASAQQHAGFQQSVLVGNSRQHQNTFFPWGDHDHKNNNLSPKTTILSNRGSNDISDCKSILKSSNKDSDGSQNQKQNHGIASSSNNSTATTKNYLFGVKKQLDPSAPAIITDTTDNVNKEKALQELKERAQFTAKMETTKTLVDKIMKVSQSMLKKKRPRVGSGSTMKKVVNSKAAKRIVSSKPMTSATSATRVVKTAAAQTAKGGTKKMMITPANTKRMGEVIVGKTVSPSSLKRPLPRSRILVQKWTKSPMMKKLSKLFRKKRFIPTPSSSSAVRKGTAAVLSSTTRKTGRTSAEATSKLLNHLAATVTKKGKGTTNLVRRKAMAQSRRRALKMSTRRVALRRVGRAFTLALPVVGGLFGLLAFQADCFRFQEEWDRRQQQLKHLQQEGITGMSQQLTSTTSSLIANTMIAFVLFLLAAIADYIDTLCQFLIAHTLFWRHDVHIDVGSTAAAVATSAPSLMAIENISMLCAIVSTTCAVVGELYSQHQQEEEEIADVEVYE